MILHVDMDAFFASVEQKVNPSLRGKPVIVGGRNNPLRSIICAASYEAKARGIQNAMSSWKAFRLCPEAIFVPADTAKYVDISRRIHAFLLTVSSRVEKFSIDEFFLDTRGCRSPGCSGHEIARRVKDGIRAAVGLPCSVGVAPTRVTAKLAAKTGKPDGLVVWTADQARREVQGFPVDKICGIGRRLKSRLNRLGIETCGQLAVYPEGILKEHFGVIGPALRRACRVEGEDDLLESCEEDHRPQSVGHSQTLPEVTRDECVIRGWLHYLCEMAASRLRAKGLAGRTVAVWVSDGFHGGWGGRRTWHEPSQDGQCLYERCIVLVKEKVPRPWQVRVMGVSVSQLLPAEKDFLYETLNRRVRLLRAMDGINSRYGPWSLYPSDLKRVGRRRAVDRMSG